MGCQGTSPKLPSPAPSDRRPIDSPAPDLFVTSSSRMPNRASFSLLAVCAALGSWQCARPKGVEPKVAASQPVEHAPVVRDESLGVFGDGTVGPYLTILNDRWLAVWAQTSGETPSWRSRWIGSDGRPVGIEHTIGAAGRDTRSVRLVSFEGRELLVLYSQLGLGGHSLGAFVVDVEGSTLAAPQLVVENRAEIAWFDALSMSDGALLFWAERRVEDAALYVAVRDRDGRVSPPVRIHPSARAWQVAATPRGALAAVVTSEQTVETVRISVAGRCDPAVEVPSSLGANSDVDLVRVGEALVLGFSKGSGAGSRVVTALLDDDGRVRRELHAVSEARHEQHLVRLLAAKRALVVSENGHDAERHVQAAWLDPSGSATSSVVSLAYGVMPEFAPLTDGVAFWATACRDAECRERVPEVHWLDARRESEVGVGLVDGPVNGVFWDLSCIGQRCALLAATTGTPTTVSVRVVEPGASALPTKPEPRTAARPALPTPAVENIVASPRLAALRAAPAADGTLLAWVSAFDPASAKSDAPAPDGRTAPPRALLQTQWVPTWAPEKANRGAAPSALPAAETLSYRARSESGLALATKQDHRLVVWSAFDGPSPQLFTTLLDAHGKRLRQAVQTRGSQGVFQVNAAALPAGWLVGWLDESDAPSLRFVDLGERLERLMPDLTPVPSQGVETFSMARVHDEVWIALGRFDGNTRSLELYRLGIRSLKVIADPVLIDTRDDPFTALSLEATASGAAVLFATAHGAWGQRLDQTGQPIDGALSLGGTRGASGAELRCQEDACAFWAAFGISGSRLELGAWDSGAPVGRAALELATPTPIAAWGSAHELWFFDEASGSGAGIRRATLP